MSMLWSAVKGMLTAGMIGLAIREDVATVAFMRGRSMLPTLSPGDQNAKFRFLSSDLILINKFANHMFNYQRGEVVVFRSPVDPNEPSYVKRLIGLPGDTIALPTGPIQVPRGHCWVEGDNASLSYDSVKMGPIPIGLIEGRVTRVLWPPARFGPVDIQIPNARIIRPFQ